MKTALKCLKAKLDYGTKYFSFCHNFTGMTWQVGLSYCLFSHFSRIKRVIWFNIGAKHLHGPKNRDKQETCSKKVSVKMFTEFSVTGENKGHQPTCYRCPVGPEPYCFHAYSSECSSGPIYTYKEIENLSGWTRSNAHFDSP